MAFNFDGKDISGWTGENIIWSGYVSNYLRDTEWTDVFGKIIEFKTHEWGDGNKVVYIYIYSEDDKKTHRFTESDLNRIVKKFELLSEHDKTQIILERKQKAVKNFTVEFLNLLQGFRVLTLEEKSEIINFNLKLNGTSS